MTTLAYQIEELKRELQKLATVRGRWMKNAWFESALLASVIMIIASLVFFCLSRSIRLLLQPSSAHKNTHRQNDLPKYVRGSTIVLLRPAGALYG